MKTKGSEALRLALYNEGVGSAQRLALALGVSAVSISRWRNGKGAPIAAGDRMALQARYGIPWQSWDEPYETASDELESLAEVG